MSRATYQVLGGDLDLDGWWKYRLLNLKTDRVVKVSRKRVADLRREGRIVEDVCSCPDRRDCECPEPKSGAALISNECPEHSLTPDVSPDCAHQGEHKNGAVSK